MDPAIDAARALLPSWVPWANVAVAAPLALATSLFAALFAAALATPSRGAPPTDFLGPSRRVQDALALSLPAVWATSVSASAGPLSRVPAPVLMVVVGLCALLGVLFVRALVRARAAGGRARWSVRALGAFAAGLGVTVAVALPLRLVLGQAWSHDSDARIFAVALTGGHDRTLADLAWSVAQRGDQARAAVLLRAALVAEGGVTPAANLAIVFANQHRCADATQALQETGRRLGRNATTRDRELAAAAGRAVAGCTEASLVPLPGARGGPSMTPLDDPGT